MSSTLVRHSISHFSVIDRYEFYDTQAFIIAMKYTYLAVFFCALWTLASSLPLTPIDSNVLARENTYQSLSRRMPPAIPHSLSLKKSAIGTAEEHWALHVHPQEAGKGHLHVLHAVSDSTKNGVLQVQHVNRGTYNGPSTNPTSHTIHLGNFATKGAAHNAINSIKNNIAPTQSYPNHNCVDFTCVAVHHLVANNHLPQSAADTMNQHYYPNHAAVRHTTNTANNRNAAGA